MTPTPPAAKPAKTQNPFASRLAVIKKDKTDTPTGNQAKSNEKDPSKATDQFKKAQGHSKGLKSGVDGKGSAPQWLVDYKKKPEKKEKKRETVEGPYGLQIGVPPSLHGPASTNFVGGKIHTVGMKKADKYLAAARVHGRHQTKAPSLRYEPNQGSPSRAGGNQANKPAPKVPTPQNFHNPR